MSKKILCFFMIVLITVSLFGCGKPSLNRYEAQYLDVFDTATFVISYNDSQETFDAQTRLIHEELMKYHKYYDIYNDYEGINNIKTINDNAGIAPVKVDSAIIELLLFAKKMYQLTDGKTNVALGSVLKIWHQYREEGLEDPAKAKLPSLQELQDAALHTDINDVMIDEKESTVYLKDPLMRLDVGAIAKGYATERVSMLAKEQGFQSGLISVGGNVRVIGMKGDTGELWNVAVQNPDTENTEKPYLHLVNITDHSLVTSGDYIRYYVVDGVRYHHIIDPVTLYPSAYAVSVTIVCKDSGVADALSTALFNMSYEEGLSLIEGITDTEAMWILPSGEEKFSSGFEELMTK
ncbi:MAG: FAD:protein FMN transferase [Eubacteriales bacterium]|nr:FAD:protein FMN transferase [Eubacteriales bacterium]